MRLHPAPRRAVVALAMLAAGTLAIGGCTDAGTRSDTPSSAPIATLSGPSATPAGRPTSTVEVRSTLWSRAPDQPALDGLAGVAWTGSRFAAIAAFGVEKPTMWDSVDGRTWHRQASPFEPTWHATGLAVGSGILAIGGGGNTPVPRFAFWHSNDGLAWSAAPDQPALYAHDNAFEDLTVIAAGDGWLAVGGEFHNSVPPWPLRAVVLTSADGLAWTREPDQVSLKDARMLGIARVPSGYITVGGAKADPSRDDSGIRAAIWTSPDGRVWTTAEPPPVPEFPVASAASDPTIVWLNGIAAFGNRLVTWGEASSLNGSFASMALAWWSDGGAWHPVKIGPGNPGYGMKITAIANGFLAIDLPTPGCTAGIWESPDGSAWTCTGNSPVFEGFFVRDVAWSPDVDVLVGRSLADPPVGASWTRSNH